MTEEPAAPAEIARVATGPAPFRPQSEAQVLPQGAFMRETRVGGIPDAARQVDAAQLARRDLIVKFFDAKGDSVLFDRPQRN